jgi:hypothetical protein
MNGTCSKGAARTARGFAVQRRWRARVSFMFGVWVASLGVFGCRRMASFDEKVAALYESWHRENEAPYRAVRQLAAERNWTAWVQCGEDSVGRFDFSRFAYERVYTPPPGRIICRTSAPDRGRLALLECKAVPPNRAYQQSAFVLVLLADGRPFISMGFEEDALRPWYGASVVLGGSQVLLVSKCGVFLFEVELKRLRALLEFQKEETIPRKKGAIVEGKYLIVFLSGPQRLLVFSALEPYREVTRAEGIRNVITVGGRIVIEKNQQCFGYDPATGTWDFLTPGALLLALGNDGFLFSSPPNDELSVSEGPLYAYNFTNRSARLVWSPRRRDAIYGLSAGFIGVYDYSKLILSPDLKFFLIPWSRGLPTSGKGPVPYVLEYEVYELGCEQRRGAFLEPRFAGERLEFLGWDEARVPPVETAPRPRRP